VACCLRKLRSACGSVSGTVSLLSTQTSTPWFAPDTLPPRLTSSSLISLPPTSCLWALLQRGGRAVADLTDDMQKQNSPLSPSFYFCVAVLVRPRRTRIKQHICLLAFLLWPSKFAKRVKCLPQGREKCHQRRWHFALDAQILEGDLVCCQKNGRRARWRENVAPEEPPQIHY
jgi:hypothetical protein